MICTRQSSWTDIDQEDKEWITVQINWHAPACSIKTYITLDHHLLNLLRSPPDILGAHYDCRALRATLLEQKGDQMAGSCCEGLRMEWVVVCVAQAKPDCLSLHTGSPRPSLRTTVRLSGYSQHEGIHIGPLIPTKHLSGRVRSKVQWSRNADGWCGVEWFTCAYYWLTDWLCCIFTKGFRDDHSHMWCRYTVSTRNNMYRGTVTAGTLYSFQLCHHYRSPQHLYQLHMLSADSVLSHLV